ncbi:MAG: TIR domain-containing protein [Pseudomonadota bacterium]
MRVYLIAAPEDETVSEELAAYLKRFGVFVRSEYGAMAYPPARMGETTLALWSRNAMMSSRQMLLTNRAIDAWSEGQLIMARLEHGLSPRGLADLDMIDLTVPSIREHRFHDVLNALRGMEDAARRGRQQQTESLTMDMPSSPPIMANSGDKARQLAEVADDEEARTALPPTQIPAPETQAKFTKTKSDQAETVSRSSGLPWLLALIAVIAGGLAAVGFWFYQGSARFGDMAFSPIILMLPIVLIAVGLLGIIAARRSTSNARKNEREDAPAPASMSEPQPVVSTSETDEAADVFISYSHQNAQTVLPIVETVEQQGVSIWIDREEMRAGQTWAGQIVRAIKASGRFCLMCSEAAFASDHVRREVYLADKYGKAMVPVRLDGTEMPEDIEYFLIGKQWIDLTSLPEDEHAEAIREAISNAVS